MLICGLYLRNLIYMFESDCPYNLMAGSARSFLDARRFFEEIRHWGSLGDKSEGAIGLDSNEGRRGDSRFYVCSSSIEFLAEVH